MSNEWDFLFEKKNVFRSQVDICVFHETANSKIYDVITGLTAYQKVCFLLLLLNAIEGYVRYIFASLFCKCKREHLWNTKKCFLSHFEIAFRSWDNQINFSRYSNVMTPSNAQTWNMKHILLNNLEYKHSMVMKFGQFMYKTLQEKTFYQKILWKNVAYKLVPSPFYFSKNPLQKGIWGEMHADFDKFW